MKKQIAVYLSKETVSQLKIKSDKNKTSISSYIREIINQHLEMDSSGEPEVCPSCGEFEDEMGQPSFIVKEDGTWACLNCGEQGRWK